MTPAKVSPRLAMVVAALVVVSSLAGVALYEFQSSTSRASHSTLGSPGFVAIANVGQLYCPPCSISPLNVEGEAEVSGGDPPYSDEWMLGTGQPNLYGANIAFNFTESGQYFTILQATDQTGATATSVWHQFLGISIGQMGENSVYAGSTLTFGDAPLTVTFVETGTSTVSAPTQSPTTLDWSFGDGTWASGVSATHTFQHPGEYLTALTATFPEGGPATTVFTVDAIGPTSPVLVFANNTVGGSCTNSLTLQFNSEVFGGSSPYSYSWSFGDGTSNSSLQDPTHTYIDQSSDVAQLTVTDARGMTGTDRFAVATEAFLCPPPALPPPGPPNSLPPKGTGAVLSAGMGVNAFQTCSRAPVHRHHPAKPG